MFYFYDPMIDQVINPPAITRMADAQTEPPRGWQWAKTKPSVSTLASGDGEEGKEKAILSPTPASKPAWQPPKGYIEWTSRSQAQLRPCPAATVKAPETWSIVSWKNLAPSSMTGSKDAVIAKIESDLAAGGVTHPIIKVYDAIRTIVALEKGG
jgi:hypothetical protein